VADEKLTNLPSVTPATGDLLYLVDISDTTDSAAGSSKKTTVGDVLALAAAPSGTGIVTVTSGSLGTPGPLTGDVTTSAGGLATTLATVNSNVGSFTLASITVDAKGRVTAASSGSASGGMEIGGAVTSGTSGRVLYVGAGPVLAQDAGLTYDPATDTLSTKIVRLPASASAVALAGGVDLDSASPGTTGVQYYSGNLEIFASGTAALVLTPSVREYRVPSNYFFCWASVTSNFAPADTAVGRAAAKVVGLSDRSTAGATLSSVPITPSQITSNQNNYAPGVARYYRLSTDASRDITGLSCSQVSGQECEIWNVDANNIVLKHQDANSTAANRFICTGAADITLAADEVALLRYDSTSSRWRVRKV